MPPRTLEEHSLKTSSHSMIWTFLNNPEGLEKFVVMDAKKPPAQRSLTLPIWQQLTPNQFPKRDGKSDEFLFHDLIENSKRAGVNLIPTTA
jgi:hypothetical protein